LERIQTYVNRFIRYAEGHPELTFMVVEIGTSNAGYKHDQIAPMFAKAPPNVQLSDRWNNLLNLDDL
jgi:hypothetical protein